jgi:hypothetical protein
LSESRSCKRERADREQQRLIESFHGVFGPACSSLLGVVNIFAAFRAADPRRDIILSRRYTRPCSTVNKEVALRDFVWVKAGIQRC